VKGVPAWLGARTDTLIASALFAGYLALLLATAGSLGFMRDEGFYFAAARAYGDWFALLWHNPAEALTPAVVDRYWAVNHEHPALIKSLFALSNRWLSGVFSQPSSSFRFPAMLLSSLAVAVTFLWGRRVVGRAAGLVAALSFAFMPHVFFHAHLACFDLPVCAMWLLTSYVYSRSLATRGRVAAVAVGVLFGLLLDTKHNSWIFPFALALHFALIEGPPLLRDVRSGAAWWRRLPLGWVSMLLLGPAVFYVLWPWLWHDTFARLREYVAFHTGHEYYNMEFLGHTYWKPPMPLGYAWLMTLATVPLVTLVLGAVGAGMAVGNELGRIRGQEPSRYRSDHMLWAVSILASYAPWLSSNTPIFGGTKHWLTAYPFLCLFAGLGFKNVTEALAGRLPQLGNVLLVGACVLVGPLVMTLHSHPFGLSAYTPLVGGAPGAASIGLNRTFWGYTTQGLAPFINRSAPKRGIVYVHDTALQSFAMFQEDGRLRPDLRGSLDIASSDIALFHYEPHMSRVEQQIWLEYSTNSPDALVAYDGVPITWAYARKAVKSP
jgi:4-amino-4-deoxy-L-arabinose transferase-like glycosyltransferase